MTTGSLRTVTPTLDIYIKLASYPILADEIRARMRAELFARGIITEEKFEAEVEEKAVESQKRERVHDPFGHEPAPVWQKRLGRIRANQTDFYFGNSLPAQLIDELIDEIVGEKQPEKANDFFSLGFNPELAPFELLFRQGEIYESLPPPERAQHEHHLKEIKVVLIKGMISDQLRFIGVAKNFFTINDLRRIYNRRMGGGKIGGKAAGMLLAWRILKNKSPKFGADISDLIHIPDSYFIGTDVIYEFRMLNGLNEFMNQKYLPFNRIKRDYQKLIQAHVEGEFPPEVAADLRSVLKEMGDSPLIVRSSSLLEDNFGSAFAGKYDSYFCPNQGSPKENLTDLLTKIKLIYASTFNPDAILYRIKNGLIDYDERMAILIQKVAGERHGKYFLPTVAGVGFSQNPFRWNEKIRREEGFLRLVLGLGTRAVNRVEQDYPRLIALSHPQLRPETTPKAIRTYSQNYVDVIDLEQNEVRAIHFTELVDQSFPYFRHVASVEQDGVINRMVSNAALDDPDSLALTFDPLTKDKRFTKLIRTALMRLEKDYDNPVDVEFAIEIIPKYPQAEYRLHLVQCRPLSQRQSQAVQLPANLPADEILFRAFHLIPNGVVEEIQHIIFVDPELYAGIPDDHIRQELGRAIGRINQKLADGKFIIIGPGRWGSANIELGVPVSYSDINNAKALIEMSVPGESGVPELSYGTHFFQDLVEAGIASLPLHLAHENSFFNWDFFRETANHLADISPNDAQLAPYLRVIDLGKESNQYRMNICMDSEKDEAVGFLVAGKWELVDLTQIPPPSQPG